MALFESTYASIAGIAACVPKTKAFTANYTNFNSESEKQLFIQTTGIKERRIASENCCTSDMCFAAAEQLIKELNWNKEEINLLIFVSQSPDYFLPATSILLQSRLGLSKNTMAFDINLGCSGYVYGLSVITSLIQQFGFGKALLLVGDKSTSSTNPKDKTTFPLFGDAGTATAIVNKKNRICFNLQSNGEGKDAIIIPGGATRNPYKEGILNDKEFESGIIRNACNLHLNGADVFNFSLSEVKPNIEKLAENFKINLEEIDFFIFHQANKLMMESIRKKMKINADKFPINIDRFGNTSSASIPLAIVTELQEKLKEKPLKLLLSGFGVGFSWGSIYLESDKNWVCPDLIEI